MRLRPFFLSCVLFFSVVVSAQRIDEYGVLQHIVTLRGGVAVLSDDYLSPLPYGGWNAELHNEWWRPFGVAPDWTHRTVLTFYGGLARNAAGSNIQTYFGGKLSWGVHYHYECARNLQLLIGPVWNFDLAGHLIGRSTNKPGSADASTHINLSVGLAYLLGLDGCDIRFRYMGQLPLVGGMFVPEMGASYYEMFSLGHLSNAFHFASFHNKVGVEQEFTVDFRCRNNTWRIGVAHEYGMWHANHLSFIRHRLTVGVGYVMDISFFSGTSNKSFRRNHYVW